LQKTYIKKENNSLKAKNLKTISSRTKLANGAQCDTNSHCESGYCGYNGPYISSSPNDYSQYACMKKYSKTHGEACWHKGECYQHYGLLFDWSRCDKIYMGDTANYIYRCN